MNTLPMKPIWDCNVTGEFNISAADARSGASNGAGHTPGHAAGEAAGGQQGQGGAGAAAAGIHQLGLRMFFRWLQGSLPFFIVLLGKVFYDHRLGQSSEVFIPLCSKHWNIVLSLALEDLPGWRPWVWTSNLYIMIYVTFITDWYQTTAMSHKYAKKKRKERKKEKKKILQKVMNELCCCCVLTTSCYH